MRDSYKKLLSALFPNREKSVFVVSGAPGSGKSRYVKERITKDDIVFDLDLITQALSMDDNLYGDREAQLNVALSLREAFYNKIIAREGKWKRCYVITAVSDMSIVHSLANKLGAEVILIDTELSECIKNIQNDERRIEYQEGYIALAKKWYVERK